jgi:hypothetical protein
MRDDSCKTDQIYMDAGQMLENPDWNERGFALLRQWTEKIMGNHWIHRELSRRSTQCALLDNTHSQASSVCERNSLRGKGVIDRRLCCFILILVAICRFRTDETWLNLVVGSNGQ